jgi:hypothetical protein
VVGRAGGFNVVPPEVARIPGAQNAACKIVHAESAPPRYRMVVEGKQGETVRMRILGAAGIASVKGAQLEGDDLVVKIPNDAKAEFARQEIIVTIK